MPVYLGRYLSLIRKVSRGAHRLAPCEGHAFGRLAQYGVHYYQTDQRNLFQRLICHSGGFQEVCKGLFVSILALLWYIGNISELENSQTEIYLHLLPLHFLHLIHLKKN